MKKVDGVPAVTEQDIEVRRLIYDAAITAGAIPHSRVLAQSMGVSREIIGHSLRRLADAHMLVLQADGEILMANPFSAVPTPFVVSIHGRTWFDNCIWDAMGIAAMLGSQAVIDASCGCCGTAMNVMVPDGCVADEPGALRDSGGTVVGRHRLQLKDDASLPVGRACPAVVQELALRTRRHVAFGHVLAPRRDVVRPRSPRSVVAPLHRGASARDFCEARVDRRVLGAEPT
jgi:hypothetical protein